MKLAILAALDDAVKQGRLGWDQVVRLDAKWSTLPSSTLIKWPLQTPITIASLANFMISISDNMATDALIDIVGRAPIEAITPRNSPFLTTSEMFKLSANADMVAAWAHAHVAARRALLERIDRLPLPDAGQLTHSTGTAEWFLSAREICALLDRVAALPAMSINPGLADPDDWMSVAYKGGSDQGVLNFSTRLVSRDGKVHCVVASWNDDKDVPMDTLAAPYRGILHKLAVPE
jgi:beta-lactamase class A